MTRGCNFLHAEEPGALAGVKILKNRLSARNPYTIVANACLA